MDPLPDWWVFCLATNQGHASDQVRERLAHTGCDVSEATATDLVADAVQMAAADWRRAVPFYFPTCDHLIRWVVIKACHLQSFGHDYVRTHTKRGAEMYALLPEPYREFVVYHKCDNFKTGSDLKYVCNLKTNEALREMIETARELLSQSGLQ